MAFEGAFEKLFNIIVNEQGLEGGVVVQDALTCIDGLLRFNQSNQVRTAVMFSLCARSNELPSCGLLARDLVNPTLAELFPRVCSPACAPVPRGLPSFPAVQYAYSTAVRSSTVGRPAETCERVTRRRYHRSTRAACWCE